MDATSKSFPKINATGRSLLIKFYSAGEEQEASAYILESITTLTNYLVSEVSGSDMVSLRKCNIENVKDEVLDIILRRCDQIKLNAVWDVLGKVN